MEKYALIVAGGSGLRMGSATPKQFLLLRNKPVLWHSVQAFYTAFPDIQIILVVPEQHLHHPYFSDLPTQHVTIVKGGETRFHSVKNGLQQIPDGAVVFVHDAVRCLVSPDLVTRCYYQTIEKGSAVPVVAATDSLRVESNGSHAVIDRETIRIVQTPQTFLSTDLKAAFDQPHLISFTDEATVMENSGKNVYLIEGEHENIKITRPVDLLVADLILQNRQP